MRKLAILLLWALINPPGFAAKSVTVVQLERLLAGAHGKSDGKAADQLSGIELSERLSSSRLAVWEERLPGPASRRALVILADEAAFLDPPAAEIPATATPDLAAQRKIMTLAVDFAQKTIHQLPNFFATRDTIHFEDSPPHRIVGSLDGSFTSGQPLQPVSESRNAVLYRDGEELVDSDVKGKGSAQDAGDLSTSGVFGPILGTVLADSGKGKLKWDQWELGAAGPEAVFRYSVPKDKSHYEVNFCCVPGGNGNGVFNQLSGYHGEIAVDPVTGAILRLTLQADLKGDEPILRADILVEYGQVKIGGVEYICPVRSISIRVQPAQSTDALGLKRYFGGIPEKDGESHPGPSQTLLNDVAFNQYHLFRSEARILTGDNSGANENPPAPVENPVEEAAATNIPPSEASAPVTGSAPASLTKPEPGLPEISIAGSTTLPRVTTAPEPASDASFTLHATSKLVDIGVVAFDKKGRPVLDLKSEEFEIYDNGRKQNVRFFSQAPGIGSARKSSSSQAEPRQPPDDSTFSNRPSAIADSNPGSEPTEANLTILLLDPGNLAWSDLTYARGQMLSFLRALPAMERRALYILKPSGFEVLQEGTDDHALLALKLKGWMPSAQDLARAQESEERNRQQFDYVLNPADLQSVNGNTDMGPETVTGVDPELRDNGSNPELRALSVLAVVARHLAAIPGHKNLVWVTSDNVLANWADKAVGSDKGSKHNEEFALRIQEAMNDAHVSIYPLDASQLETMAVDASLANANVELSPSVTAPPQPQGGGAGAGRITAELQQDIHPIQAQLQQMAKATGGQAFSRTSDIARNLAQVAADGRAEYLLSFTPDTPADGQYHLLTVKLAGRRGIALRYRAGYEYLKEPATLKDRFRQAVWQSLDASEIGVSAHLVPASEGATVQVDIATHDLALKQQDDRWQDQLDIFLVRRDDEGLHSLVTEQTLKMNLTAATYTKLLQQGTPFNQFIERKPETGSVRIIVVDENSGRMGSVTVPALALPSAN